jgi:hypothetical protein
MKELIAVAFVVGLSIVLSTGLSPGYWLQSIAAVNAEMDRHEFQRQKTYAPLACFPSFLKGTFDD